MHVADVMTRGVVSVPPATPLKDVAELLLRHRIGGVPVVDGGRVVGVVSETDIVRVERGAREPPRGFSRSVSRGRRRPPPAALNARDAMTEPPVCVRTSLEVAAAARLMTDRGIDRLPVLDADGELTGILARADLVRAFVRPDDEIERQIEREVLEPLGIAAGEIVVAVERGEVVLAGEIDRLVDLESIPPAVRDVPGVVRVRDRLGLRTGVSGECGCARTEGSARGARASGRGAPPAGSRHPSSPVGRPGSARRP